MTGTNVIPLKAVRSRLRSHRPVQPPPALMGAIPVTARAQAADELEDRLRMRQNFAALAVTVCIVVLGTWLIESLRSYSQLHLCLEAGHHNCIPLEQKYQPTRY